VGGRHSRLMAGMEKGLGMPRFPSGGAWALLAARMSLWEQRGHPISLTWLPRDFSPLSCHGGAWAVDIADWRLGQVCAGSGKGCGQDVGSVPCYIV
jgi:hypothetical protein